MHIYSFSCLRGTLEVTLCTPKKKMWKKRKKKTGKTMRKRIGRTMPKKKGKKKGKKGKGKSE